MKDSDKKYIHPNRHFKTPEDLEKFWDDYKNLDVSKIPNLESIDALVMTVSHNSFKKINFSKLLKFNQKITILDTFNILTNKQIAQIKKKKCKIL